MPVAVNGTKKGDTFMGTVSLRLITPDDLPLLWKWLNEYPHQNFDDYGPKCIEEFEVELIRRIQRGDVIWVALHNDKPVGCIGFAPETPRRGSLRGICFAKSVHRTGVAGCAFDNFLKMLWASKIEKISAEYFRDNTQIKNFLKKRGFEHEGTRKDHTLRRGVLTTVALVALHKKNFMETVN